MKCFGQGRYAIGCRSYATWECAADGACFTTDASFRVYATAADSFADHGALLARNTRYRAAFAYRAEPDRFVAQVHRAGYATDPLYTAKLINLMVRYDLYRYDITAS
jgi:flagellum-specific peptidoglycan hydrolase FlgJ